VMREAGECPVESPRDLPAAAAVVQALRAQPRGGPPAPGAGTWSQTSRGSVEFNAFVSEQCRRGKSLYGCFCERGEALELCDLGAHQPGMQEHLRVYSAVPQQDSGWGAVAIRHELQPRVQGLPLEESHTQRECSRTS
jgi:hypothetical protein